jgi:hypothetical protein
MGLLGKIFGGGKKEFEFQRKVLRVLEPFSGIVDVRAGDSPLMISFNGIELDLMQLQERCSSNEVQSEDIIRQYFSFSAFLCEIKIAFLVRIAIACSAANRAGSHGESV